MEITTLGKKLDTLTGDCLILGVFENEGVRGPVSAIDRAMKGRLKTTLSSDGFKGKFLETILIRPSGPVGLNRIVLVGLGKREAVSSDRLRQAVGKGTSVAKKIGTTSLFVYCDPRLLSKKGAVLELAQTLVEGVILSQYRFDRFKSKSSKNKDDKEILSCTLVVPDEKLCADAELGGQTGKAIAAGVHYVRDLCNSPANVVTPSYLAKEASLLAEQDGVKVDIFERADIEKFGMGAFNAVTLGTEEDPKFIVIEYQGSASKKSRPVALVGKAVTFDSGGISIKPSANMDQMKYDMSGGATVLGVMKTLVQLQLPINVVGLIPSTDNMPSGTAVHPGDVVTTLSGKTVQIDNTDAEGRLLLADALSYAARYKPTAMIDLATLTGACVIALGQHAIGLMGNNKTLVSKIQGAGEDCGERLWPLPLWDAYFNQIEGDVADLKNVGGRSAGTITAGLFLKQFVGEIPWVHLDIAGTSWYSDNRHAYIPKGATGIGVRLLIHYLSKSARRKKTSAK